jgi:hypothetical protein
VMTRENDDIARAVHVMCLYLRHVITTT